MIKKLITLIFCILIISQTIFSEQIMFLDGIGSPVPKLSGVDTTTNTSTATVIQKMAEQYTSPDQILICHSQGGLRALAYAEKLHNNRVKAIVTIGSPIQGEHALLYGGANLHSRLRKRLDNIVTTADLAAAPVLIPALIGSALYDAFNGTSYSSDLAKMTTTDGILNTVFGLVDNPMTDFIKDAANDPNIGFNPGALEAMTPNSAFQKEYIFPKSEIYQKPPEFVTKLIGYVSLPKIVGWNWIFPIISWVRTPVYAPVLVFYAPKTITTRRLTSTQKVGHVTAGGSSTAGSDILQMVEDATGTVTKAAVESWLNTGKIVSNVTGGVYSAEAVALTVAIPAGGVLLAIPFAAAATNCFDTGAFLGDFNNKFSKEIYLTTAHDGFVNTSGMVYPSGNNNLWLLNTKAKSTKHFPELNHKTERTSPLVWGDGSFGSKVGSYGAVNDLIKTTTNLRNGTSGY